MKYRKKPVVTDAVQWTGDNLADVATLLHLDHVSTNAAYAEPDGPPKLYTRDTELVMTTVHGEKAVARVNDWVIPEPQPGRAYPCKPDIFESTYQEVGDGAAGIRVLLSDFPEPVEYPAADGWFISASDYLNVTTASESGAREEVAVYRPAAWRGVEDIKFDTHPAERDPETAEAAELGVAALRSRIRVLEAEVSQSVDRSYRSAVSALVGLFHPRSAGLQTLRELGDADHKITLTDVVAAIGMHVQGNTLGAPPDYQPPAPAVPPEERAAFVTAASELGEQS